MPGTDNRYKGPDFSLFDGAITTHDLQNSAKEFEAEIIFHLQHPRLLELAATKPPLHFHPYQDEYFRVIEGSLGVDIADESRVIGPEDGEVCVKAWVHHRLYPRYPPKGEEEDENSVTKFIMSGSRTEEERRLDTLFFSNWYAYQDDVVRNFRRFNLIQILAMFDAGGSYLSLPWWVPFGRTVSRTIGVVLGRWIGGLLGYQPYYRDWSTDWEVACERMRLCPFQRRFARLKTV